MPWQRGRKHSLETIEKIRQSSRLSLLRKYQTPWGDMKRESQSVLVRSSHPMDSKAAREKMSSLLSGSGNPMFGKTGTLSPRFGKTSFHSKKFSYNGVRLDSSYELAYVKMLDERMVCWKRNRTRIYLKDEKGRFTFCPDFLVDGHFVEIKGWFGPRTQRILRALKRIGYKVEFLGKKELLSLGCEI